MKKMFLIKVCFIFFFLEIVGFESFGQNFTETVEFENNIKRRTIKYDNNLNIVSEVYFGFKKYSNETQVIGTVNYTSNGEIEKIITFRNYPKKYIEVDFKSGVYRNYIKNIVLRFKPNFIFDGIQQGNKIIVNYKDGKREGRCLQTDSGVINTRNVVVQRPDINLLQFDIVKFSSQLQTEDVYKLFNGFVCSFNDDKLYGNVNGFYLSGNKRFESRYYNDILLNYTSFEESGLLVSKIPNTSNGVVTGNIISNGIVTSDRISNLVVNTKVLNVGKIYSSDFTESFRGSEQIESQLRDKNLSPFIYNTIISLHKFERKKFVDKYKIILTDPEQVLSLFEVPNFEIERFSTNDENSLQYYKFSLDSLETILFQDLIDELKSFNIKYYKDKGMLTSNYNQSEFTGRDWSDRNQWGQIFYIKNPDQSNVTNNEKEETDLLVNNIRNIIFNSVLLKNDLIKYIKPNIDNVVWFDEKNGTRLRVIDEKGIKYVEISLESNDIYERVSKNLYTYFDGHQKYKFHFNVSSDGITLDKYWIGE